MPLQLGDTTASGMLYEGNYAEWEVRMCAVLRAHGFRLVDNNLEHGIWRAYGALSPYNTIAKDLIHSYSSPRLYARLPQQCREDANLALAALKLFAQPFRLSDLPPGLRSSIFEMHLSSSGCRDGRLYRENGIVIREYHHVGRGEDLAVAPLRIPFVAMASRLFRAEALPLFFKLLEVRIIGWRSSGKVKIGLFLKWASALPPCLKKMLTKVVFCTRIRCESAKNGSSRWVEFKSEHSIAAGLRCQSDARLTHESRTMVEQHIEEVGELSKALGLKGESIILAIAASSKLWDMEEGPLSVQR